MLTVSVVICAYTLDRWDDLVASVRSVQNQTRPVTETIVVVDHNPELADRCRQHLRDAVVVESRHAKGLSGARNTGIDIARGDVVAFLDDDARAAPTWIERLLVHYDDDRVLGVGGAIVPRWRGGDPQWFPPEFLWVVGCSYRGLPTTSAPVRNFIGANMSFRRDAFADGLRFAEGIGRVDAVPLGCEETELCIQLRQRFPDSELVYEPAAEVEHMLGAPRASWSYFAARCRAEGRSKALVAARVGAGDALESERAYVRRTLPTGILDAVRDMPAHGARPGALRAGAIVAGAALTASAYTVGRIRSRRGATTRNALVRGSTTATPVNVDYRIGLVREQLPLQGRWLDCGCADGGYSRAMLDAGVTEVFGIDVEEDRVLAAKRRVPEGNFQIAASEALPFDDGFFDAVFMNEVLEHVENEELSLREAYRVLRPGGALVLMSPNRWFPFEGHEIHVGAWVSNVPTPGVPWLPRALTNRWTTARNYWPHELRDQIAAAGFVIAEQGFVLPVLEEYPWLPPALVQRYQAKIDRLDDLAAIRRFGVSNLVVACKPVAATAQR